MVGGCVVVGSCVVIGAGVLVVGVVTNVAGADVDALQRLHRFRQCRLKSVIFPRASFSLHLPMLPGSVHCVMKGIIARAAAALKPALSSLQAAGATGPLHSPHRTGQWSLKSVNLPKVSPSVHMTSLPSSLHGLGGTHV